MFDALCSEIKPMLIKNNPTFTIILVCITGLTLSYIGADLIYKDNESIKEIENQKAFLEFKNKVDNRVAAFNRDLEVNFEALRSIAILFSDDKKPSLKQFNQLSESIIFRHSAIQAFSWVPRVQSTDRTIIEKKARNLFPDFEIYQRGPDGLSTVSNRSEYFPVYYIHPLAGNKRALGFDLASDAKRHDALKKARDSGELTATASITLVQEKAQQKGFLVFMPLYSGSHAVLDDRQKNLTGFITGVYRIGDIFNHSVWSTINAPDISFKIVEKITSNEKSTLYLSNNSEDIFDNPVTQFNGKNTPIYFYETELANILGQKWVLFAAKQNIKTRSNDLNGPFLFFVIGALFSIFVSIYIKITANYSKRLSHLNKQLDAISHIDGLTNIPNRRTFDEFIKKEWFRAARNKTLISVLLIDVDYFKLYNDHYGHVCGDLVLKQVATALQAVIKRPADLIARYGGEEFIIVLPDSEHAELVANTCTQVIRDLEICHEFSEVAPIVTVSVGFASCIPDLSVDLSTITENADKALYQAKESGRNRAMKFRA
jgi:diguanylate cyclase (GGDEF)-like protein